MSVEIFAGCFVPAEYAEAIIAEREREALEAIAEREREALMCELHAYVSNKANANNPDFGIACTAYSDMFKEENGFRPHFLWDWD